MPKVVVNDTQGLFQETGEGIEISNSLSFGSKGGYLRPTETLTGVSNPLTEQDSGKIIFVDASAANVAIQLPAVATLSSGWHVRIISKETVGGSQSVAVTTNSSENKLVGHCVVYAANGSMDVTNDTDGDTITFASTCLAGSWVDIFTNGSSFFIYGVGSHATATNVLTIAGT